MINPTQLYARTPYTSLTGTELVVIEGGSGTGAGVMNTLKTFFKSGFAAADVTDATVLGKQLMKVTDQAAAKILLDIPAQPLAPVTISANTTLGAGNINRRNFVTSPITLTLNAAAASMSDTLLIINVSSGAVTLNPGAGEDLIVWGSGAAATYSIPVNYCVKAYRVDANTWFIEY